MGAWAVTAGEVENEYDRAQHEAQQSALRKAVILRQRKNSTAIKVGGYSIHSYRHGIGQHFFNNMEFLK